MWQRFTEKARLIVFRAQEEARALEENFVGPEHLLLGMLVAEGNLGLRALERLNVEPEQIRAEIMRQVKRGADNEGKDMELTPRAKIVVDLAYEEARRMKNDWIGGEHLLLGLLLEKKSLAARVLIGLGLTLETVRQTVGELWAESALQNAIGKPDEELLSLDEAVKFLGTSKPTLYRVLGQGDLKGLKVGRQWRFRKADLVAYMERSPAVAAPHSDLDAALEFLTEQQRLQSVSDTPPESEETRPPEPPPADEDAEKKTIRLAHKILQLAIARRVSDIHLEPTREEGANFLRLRYRVDGALQEILRLPFSVQEALTTRFKVMSDLNLNEKRVPQDGRIPVRHQGKDFDVRVSVVPSLFGEDIVMRIIVKSDVVLGLDNLGLADDDLGQIRGLLHQPNGLVIATGPTGSGKTTLMYSCLEELAQREVKTITVEDPIELPMPYTTQVEVNKRNGVTFAGALRSFLRQDPDIIYVGETGDPETAALAVEASLTGHLVLTTLHTNDAPSALTRLPEMGLESYLIAATVSGIVAQRLCRRICGDCKESYQVPARELMRFGLEPDDPHQTITLSRGKGCDKCRQKGYRGRIGLFELLVMTDEIADLIVNHAPQAEIAAAARAAGMNNLWQDGLLKVLDGVTTPDEVLRVCMAI